MCSGEQECGGMESHRGEFWGVIFTGVKYEVWAIAKYLKESDGIARSLFRFWHFMG